MTAIIAGLVVGCGNNQQASVEESPASVEEQADANDTATENAADDSANEAASTAELPAYSYPGPEAFYSVVYDKVLEFAKDYDKADVSIPVVQEIELDEDDKSDIKYYGVFEIENYNLDGTTLMTQSGGVYPGVMHISIDEEGAYKVDSIEIVEDGSDFDASAKKIFGDEYDDFMEKYSDDNERNELRAQIIANYVFANNLDITSYQDYGWDPVQLPEENIDSFYSQLD